jgi:hypothetical protein
MLLRRHGKAREVTLPILTLDQRTFGPWTVSLLPSRLQRIYFFLRHLMTRCASQRRHFYRMPLDEGVEDFVERG